MKRLVSLLVLGVVVLASACATLVDTDFGAFNPPLGNDSGADGACKTCQSLGAQCGIQDDGCGNALDCSPDAGCPNGGTCDGLHCVCTGKSCSALGVQCGPTDDGCGNSIDCGSCAAGLSCVAGQCKCVAKTCADYGNPTCGTYPTGCGMDTINCGTACPTNEFCQNGKQCVTTCTKKTCTGSPNMCDVESDGCGGTYGPCKTCTSPQTCGGSGVAGACGCTPKTCAEVGNPCDAVADGCGGMVGPCTTCTSPQTCGGGGMSGVCGCTPSGKCPTGSNCGTVSNGCGGYISCGGVCPIDYACESNKCTYIGGGGCFPGQALVLMADGTERPISSVRVGDGVMTYDAASRSFLSDTVAEVDVHGPEVSQSGLLLINGVLEATPNHPIFTARGAVAASDLRVGDQILTTTRSITGAPVGHVESVKSIVPERGGMPVYTIKPTSGLTFVVGGVVTFIKQ